VDDSNRPAFTPQEAERRHLSVVFCDLVGSTAMSEQLDPEVLHETLLAYQDCAEGVVQRHEGLLAHVMGDGLLIFFGYPAARDDDAERAVRCACDLLIALSAVESVLPLKARIGIHSGPVVVGQMRTSSGHRGINATGLTTNVAARIQSIAEPDTIVISAATQRLVSGLFIVRSLDLLQLKGIEKPLQLYEVIRPSGVRSRLDAAHRLTALAGRETELAVALERWALARQGQGQGMLIVADPGLGKSRMLLTLREQVRDTPHTWLECRASATTRNSAYRPIVELLQRGLAFKDEDSDRVRIERLKRGLDGAGLLCTEALQLLAPLLNLELAEGPLTYGSELIRRKTIDLLCGWFIALAGQQPLLLAIEDLHWVDATTLEVLSRLLERMTGTSVMVLMTARPEFKPPWPAAVHVSTHGLPPLDDVQAGEMLFDLAGQHRLPPELIRKVQRRANGVPLFIEEIAKQLLESGQLVVGDEALDLTVTFDTLAIPETLQDSLMARLDRLGPAKRVAQVAAVIGRECDFALLAGVAGLGDRDLRDLLHRLVDAELLYQSGEPPQARYQFKHALIQDAAYNSLLNASKQRLHGTIAETLHAHHPDRCKAAPAEVAQHFERAGQILMAVEYFKRAADASHRSSVDHEALAYTLRALALLEQFSEGDERNRIELALLLVLVPCLYTTRGYGHADVVQALRRLRVLQPLVPDAELQVQSLLHLAFSNGYRGDFEAATDASRTLAELGRTIGSSAAEGTGVGWLGVCEIWRGRYLEASRLASDAVKILESASPAARRQLHRRDPLTNALTVMAWTRWSMGYPDQALVLAKEVVANAQATGQPFVICVAESLVLTSVLLMRREAQPLLDACNAAIASTQRYNDVQYLMWARTILPLAQLMRNPDSEAHFQEFARYQAAWQSTGVVTWDPFHYVMIAERQLAAGRLAQAGVSLDGAFNAAQRDLRLWQAESHRVRGEWWLAVGADHHYQAERNFLDAIEIARVQQTKSFELRATTSLARLWRQQNRRTQARDLLQPVYEWFTEGFDTPDLKEALTLLNELE